MSFPVFEKIEVNGPGAQPLRRFATITRPEEIEPALRKALGTA